MQPKGAVKALAAPSDFPAGARRSNSGAPFVYLDSKDHVASRIRKAQTLAESANKPVALLLCRDLMWEEPA